MTYTELYTLLKSCICDCLGADLHSGRVREAYQQSDAPQFTINDDVVVTYLTEKDDPYSHQRNTVYEETNDSVILHHKGTRVWDLHCYCYGPNSYEMADLIRSHILTSQLKSKLHRHNVALVPTIPTIQGMPEQAQGQWWSRWDITLTFNESYDYTEDVGTIDHIHTTVGIAKSPNQIDLSKTKTFNDMFTTNR